jgi:catalase
MATLTGSRAPDKQILYEQLVDTLNAVFGLHPGYRAVHAKGVVCEGVFKPAASAPSLTRAPHLQGGTVPVTVRFSDFAGIPNVPDGDASASPRGMSIRFHLPGGASTDIVAHSYDGFPVRTAEEFLAFLHALATSGPDAPKPTPLEIFLERHPHAKEFVQACKPTPRSFATEAYYGVDALRFTNREGVSRYGRYRILPIAGKRYLDPAEAARRPLNFLFDELTERLDRNPAEFRLVVQLAADEDPIDDPSVTWPDRRPQVELGTLTITRQVADSDVAQRKLAFDPGRLVDGIEPSEDPLIQARSAIYAIAARRRSTERT